MVSSNDSCGFSSPSALLSNIDRIPGADDLNKQQINQPRDTTNKTETTAYEVALLRANVRSMRTT